MNIELEDIIWRVLHPHADLIPTLKVGKEAGAINQVWMSPTLLDGCAGKEKSGGWYEGTGRHVMGVDMGNQLGQMATGLWVSRVCSWHEGRRQCTRSTYSLSSLGRSILTEKIAAMKCSGSTGVVLNVPVIFQIALF